MSTYLRNWVEDWELNNTTGSPWRLPADEAAAYVATTEPGTLSTAATVVDWLARGLNWAELVVYKTSVAGWHAATEHSARVTGRSYARSGATLAALGLVPAPTAGALPNLDLLCDATDRDAGESAGVLRPTRSASGLRIFWVSGLDTMCTPNNVPPGLHLRAMLESGSLAAEATALRLLTDSQVSMGEVSVTLTT
ncbi:hypothetical protein [Brevibacterium linens]|uniref:Uncharacterized protein n=1 Tax=Brevibacterium linens TaxID=1703 RepID=A0A2H1IKW3_BRELN|nr:hypothetical protein [Brevibacterium linens]SMX75855.1 hypothetical protein BLIN101_01312 [Brevibacterium linens]